MKSVHKVLSLVFALAMCMAIPVSASSVPQTFSDGSQWTTDSCGDQICIVDNEAANTSPETPLQPFTTRGRSLLFRMTLTAMYNDLNSGRVGGFTVADLDNAYVRASGRIDNDQNEYVTIGLCKYDDEYIPLSWTYRDVACGTYFVESWPKSSLDWHYDYYGYVQSPYLSNTSPYSGYIDYFDSSEN